MVINTSITFYRILLIILAIVGIVLMTFDNREDLEMVINYEQLQYKYQVKPRDKLEISYIHSIHLTPVREIFFVNRDGTFTLNTVHFKDIGWGSPFDMTLDSKTKKYTFNGYEKMKSLNYGFITINEPKVFLNNNMLNIELNQIGIINIYINNN